MQRDIKTVFTRFCISWFWIALIFFFLYLPSFVYMLRPTKSINILVWADLFSAQMISQFEKETGISVYVSYFTSNEELFVKLKSTKGGLYDMIMPSDYMVQQLIDEKLLQPLDTKKLNFMDRLDPRLLNLPYDPANTYSIPYYWGIYGLGINQNFFGAMPEATWGLIFNKDKISYKVAMPNVAREAIMIAALYLFGTVEKLTNEQLQQIAELLYQQKKWVEVYLDYRPDHLLVAKTCPVVVTSTPSLWKYIHPNNDIRFLLPKEGSFFITDTIAIPVKSTNADLVHQFINYVYTKAVIRQQFKDHVFFPATTDLQELFKEFNVDESIQQAHSGDLSGLTYFKNVVPEEIMTNIWISLKAR